MWDDDHRALQTRPDTPPQTNRLVSQYADDGIAYYLRTMCEVAHTPGMCHWCTPGHNRGKASEALSAALCTEAIHG